ncbi:MAG: hypothetical protein AB1779_10770, partial [Candidatus Thermoplasmatota archaeon]
WGTLSDDKLINIIKKIHKLKMKVMLKPHLDPLKGDRWQIMYDGIFYTKAWVKRDWDSWFSSYEKFITHYASLAEKYDVELFCIGCELDSTVHKEKEWRNIIKSVRNVYSGKLTYASLLYQTWPILRYALGGHEVKFWDSLDYAGIDAYYPLTLLNNNPTVAQLKSGWYRYLLIFDWVSSLENWHAKHKKPVLFTEIGYRSLDGTNRNPGDWKMKGNVDLKEQEDCYKAAFEVFFGKSWLYGMYWWSWEGTTKIDSKNDTGYTPQGKPAEAILRGYY